MTDHQNSSQAQTSAALAGPTITDAEFSEFKQLLYQWAGIFMADSKKALVSGRLMNRVRFYACSSFSEYLAIVLGREHTEEKQIVINLLTTNETYFFREPQHFDWLRRKVLERNPQQTFRVWCAACSSGEEAYSVAMTLADMLGMQSWQVYASDISERIVHKAFESTYAMERAANIPDKLLKRYCLKGVNESEGTLRIVPELRSQMRFFNLNLIEPLPSNFGLFDVIFLRNVLIYFDRQTRKKVVDALAQFLKPDGNLIVGHAESLHGITDQLKTVQPTIYAAAKT